MNRPAIVTVYQQKADGTPAILIPKLIREKLGIVTGTRLMVYESDGLMACEPIDKQATKGVQESSSR